VLIFRESHGWEVRHDFFTDQFKGLTLDGDSNLSARIDGISGATLSVNALRNLARFALYLDRAARAPPS
jgi:Na+-transporting NADH:ubiquinone oxidoreductase subunit NqrC